MSGVKPICDVCDKPVDRFETVDDHFIGRRQFRAYCHGDMQCVEMFQEELATAGLSISLCRAFTQPKRLTP